MLPLPTSHPDIRLIKLRSECHRVGKQDCNNSQLHNCHVSRTTDWSEFLPADGMGMGQDLQQGFAGTRMVENLGQRAEFTQHTTRLTRDILSTWGNHKSRLVCFQETVHKQLPQLLSSQTASNITSASNPVKHALYPPSLSWFFRRWFKRVSQ